MEIQAALLIASKVMVKGISLLNYGMSLDMTDTKIVGLSTFH